MPNNVYTATPLELIVGTYANSAQNIATTGSAGQANTISRGDHVHAISLATGDSNGQVKIAGSNVSVKGLGTMAYAATGSYVAKAGDTMTGGLTMQDTNIVIKRTAVNSTSATNGITSNMGNGLYGNSATGDFGRCLFYSLTNGSHRVYLQVRNYTNSAWTGYGGIVIQAANDGTITYEVSNGASFRSAIGAGTSSLAIGTTASTAAAGNHTHSTYLPLAGGVMTGAIQFNSKGSCSIYNGPNDAGNGVGGALNNLVINSWYGVSFTTTCTGQTYTGTNAFSINTRNGYAYCARMHNAVWNDYAEYRESKIDKPGLCVQENDNGILTLSDKRLIPGACIVSDTYGNAMGKTEKATTPIAVSGRVLVYTSQSRENYHAGMSVCSAPDGKVDIMTREEIQKYPDAIIGIVSEIPDYEEWGSENVKVDGRIWIKVR